MPAQHHPIAADDAMRREEARLLHDAAEVFAARRELDGLLGRLAADPFDVAAYHGLRRYLGARAERAAAAWARLGQRANPPMPPGAVEGPEPAPLGPAPPRVGAGEVP